MNGPRTTARLAYDAGSEITLFSLNDECVEFPLLLCNSQYAALEIAAEGEGLTIAQLLRRLIAAYLAERGPG